MVCWVLFQMQTTAAAAGPEALLEWDPCEGEGRGEGDGKDEEV